MGKRGSWVGVLALVAVALGCPGDDDDGWVNGTPSDKVTGPGEFAVRMRADKTTLGIRERGTVFIEYSIAAFPTDYDKGTVCMFMSADGDVVGVIGAGQEGRESVHGKCHTDTKGLGVSTGTLDAPFECKKAGVGSIGAAGYGSFQVGDGPKTAMTGSSARIEIRCEGTDVVGDSPRSYMMSAVPVAADELVPTVALVPKFNGDDWVWDNGDELVVTFRGTVITNPDPGGQGFGKVADVPSVLLGATREQVALWCDEYADTVSKSMSQVGPGCDFLLAEPGAGGGGGGPDAGPGGGGPAVLVDPCAAFAPTDIEAVVGHTVVEESQGWDSVEGGICAYYQPSATDFSYTTYFIVDNISGTLAKLQQLFFLPTGLGTGNNVFTVINDAGGILDAELADGMVDAGGELQPLVRGTPDPALGSLTVMQHNDEYTEVMTFLDGKAAGIRIRVSRVAPEMFDTIPAAAIHQGYALELARMIYAAHVAANP